MANMPLPPAVYVDSQPGLVKLVEQLARESLVAVDTESNSLYAYQEQVCLIQLSTRTQDYVVDPLAVSDLSPLGSIISAPHIEKVFHAAEYDIVCMKRDFGFEFRNLFDTMLAARICGFKSVGLSSMLSEYAGVKIDKSHQRDNWGKRPLPEDSLRYAQMDTHFLPYLRDELYRFLENAGHLEEAQETFEETSQLPAASKREFDPDAFWQLGQPNFLKRPEMLVLKEVYQERETIACEENLPPFKVMTNSALVALSRTMPTSLAEMEAINGVSADQCARYGDRMLRAVRTGQSARRLPPPPRSQPPDSAIMDRYAVLHLWRKERAQFRGVDSDVIVSKQTLWDLAHKDPASLSNLADVRGLGPWRMATYGQEILNVLQDFREMEGK